MNLSIVSDQVSRAPFQNVEFLVGGDFDGISKNSPLNNRVATWSGQTSHVSVVFGQISWNGHLHVNGGGSEGCVVEVVDGGDPGVNRCVVGLYRVVLKECDGNG